MSEMQAAYLTKPGKFELRTVAKPTPKDDEVLIKVSNCNICGTDMHIFNGHYSADKLPMVLGHEFSGVITELGKSVNHLSIGQSVTVDINKGCGHCYYCRQNEIMNCPDISQIGIHENGAFAEYIAVPARLVLVAPEGTSLELLSLVEPVACVVRAARKAQVSFGQSVVILGAGPIGNLHVQMMRLIGAAPIIIADLSEERTQMALDVGADIAVTNMDQLQQVVRNHTESRGADIVIESVGIPQLYEKAFELIRPGGHVSAFGITDEHGALSLKLLDMVLKETSIKGSVAGMGQDMHDAMTLLLHYRFKTDAFNSCTFPLEDIQNAFEQVASQSRPDVLKVQVKVS
ncbi:putative Threonine dehydrogenase and related Zn-dependent dehydrogenase [Vibrio nigripulchritudo MADA3029]|uniref:zinc-dependent alcohol dehydrogenase n=1 Tax=Vibrio nigripulchritudo TaxID=28173 RepID=UPI0003B19046|nr:alcohol dehydrogenase catalytic domain-containing protein [Vibrio nigripulchritudo]CCN46590.1 putative Threonine dehydrogenase and related Zn-dependent dehydrogenase [Vibrio nigripulchritudo MADA3020]CCN54633.1 putative Threonine dehydrogenase and related Zn-dependent dehydrogenase [Vibrio nigripulchritudo MADA3021]CCN59449.1 putative Threonine dehydrogenase and related Zn-dependent dehydrogenase [Vibrio nigripulchritudo MADA3029]